MPIFQLRAKQTSQGHTVCKKQSQGQTLLESLQTLSTVPLVPKRGSDRHKDDEEDVGGVCTHA